MAKYLSWRRFWGRVHFASRFLEGEEPNGVREGPGPYSQKPLFEHHHLPDPHALSQPVEAFVDLAEAQAMRQQLVDRQAAGAE